jgi:hypothetical protein
VKRKNTLQLSQQPVNEEFAVAQKDVYPLEQELISMTKGRKVVHEVSGL